jgi:hypothetical protein
MAEIAKHAENQPWPSLEWASWIFDRASFVLVGSLVIGAAATIAIVWMGIVKEHHWDLARDQAAERIASLELETARANEEISKANMGAAEATARALEAQVALEKLRTPRALDANKQSRIAEKIKPFAGVPFDVALQPDPEPIGLLSQIISALEAGGWKQRNWSNSTGVIFNGPNGREAGILYVEGLHVEFSETKPEWEAPVLALIRALAAEGVEVKGTRATKANSDAIHVIIGRKPM